MGERVTRNRGDLLQSLISQNVHGTKHVEHIRRTHQEMGPVIDHVRHMAHKVNEAPVKGNRNGWQHIGSIPTSILMDWLQKEGATWDQFARNEGGIKTRFKDWFLNNRDLRHFRTDSHSHRIKRVYAP